MVNVIKFDSSSVLLFCPKCSVWEVYIKDLELYSFEVGEEIKCKCHKKTKL